MKELIDFYPALGDEAGTGEFEEHWRDRKPPLIVDSRIFELGFEVPGADIHRLKEAKDKEINPAVRKLQEELFTGIAEAFLDEDCDIIPWPTVDPDLQKKKGRRSHEFFSSLEFFTGLRAIDLGKFSAKQKAAFDIRVTNEESFWEFVEAYNLASPQSEPASRDFSREVDLAESYPPTYANVLFRQVEPDDDIPQSLGPKQQEGMNWVDMAHYGSWKVLQVCWYEDEQGEPQVKNIMLGTLEGSHPLFGNNGETQGRGSLPELAQEIGRRFKIIGSTKEVFAEFRKQEKNMRLNYDDDPDDPVPEEVWNKLPAVQSMMKAGRFLGARDLISGPVELARLAYGRFMPRFLERAAQYSQQAESARCLWEPMIDRLVVSVTGTLGGNKVDTEPEDFVAVRPGGKLGLLLHKIGEKSGRKPSVEAREFALPMYEMAQEIPGFSFKVDRNDEDGSYTANENGDYTMWRIVGVEHLHRDVKLDQLDPTQIIVLEPEDLDAVGCGVDANETKSKHALNQAYAKGQEFFEEHGYWPTAAVVYIPNHGWNAIKFAVEDENGNIGEDLDGGFRDAIENGALVYGTFAEGVTQV